MRMYWNSVVIEGKSSAVNTKTLFSSVQAVETTMSVTKNNILFNMITEIIQRSQSCSHINKYLMFNFSKLVQNFSPNNLLSNISTQYSKIKQRISPKYEITQIIKQIYHIPYPQLQNIPELLAHVGPSRYLIVNIGEYDYELQFIKRLKQKNVNGKLKHIAFQYYSSIPFWSLIDMIKEITGFVEQKQDEQGDRKVYVLCQQNKIRSAVFLSSYIYVNNSLGIEDISQSILYVNKKLNLQIQQGMDSSLYKNHHILFKNLIQYTSEPQFINKNHLKLIKISINNIPKIKIQLVPNKFKTVDLQQIKVAIQIRCGSKIVHKSLYNQIIIQGQLIQLKLNNIQKKVMLSDEFLLIIKHVHNKKIYNIMRIQLNTNFIFKQFYRIHQHDIDFSQICDLQKEKKEKTLTYVDLEFQGDTEISQLAKKALREKQKDCKKKWGTYLLKKDNNNDVIEISKTVDNEAKKEEQNIQSIQNNFDWMNEDIDFDDNDINNKIEQVMKTLNMKEQQRANDKVQDRKEQEEDLDDYLKNLQSLA